MADTYPPSPRTVPSRLRERASYDEALVHGILDEALGCHVAFVADGDPVVLPTLHVRVDRTLYLHGSTGARLLRGSAGGVRVSVAATLVDGLVLARSAFHHSINYRSVVVHGVATRVDGEDEQRAALDALVEHVATGRAADCRPPSRKELAATAVLRLPIREVSAKVRTGGPVDEPADLTLPHWSGVLPLGLAVHEPVAAEDAGPAPGYLRAYRRAG